MPQLPFDTIIIGPLTYAIVFETRMFRVNEDGSTNWIDGRIEYGKAVVKLNSELADQSVVPVLWHELLHGILDNAGQHVQPEGIIEALANGITQLLRDNPLLYQATIHQEETNDKT